MLRNVLPECPAAPIGGARDRARAIAQFKRQARPDERKVTVAPGIAEIDALRRVRRTAEPEKARAGERPGEAAQGAVGEGVENHGFVAAVAIIASRCRSTRCASARAHISVLPLIRGERD